MELKSISDHRPKGLVIDVAEEDAKALLKTGEFIESIKEKLIVKKKVEEKPILDEPLDESLDEHTEEVLTFVKKEEEAEQKEK